ncbi:hypothetical protein SBDP1_520055 [Syntrophobacter sp. SbD1]|nr:hypothetical protein SBDP1_520055 [Syntrophobacter sp. SbD1]
MLAKNTGQDSSRGSLAVCPCYVNEANLAVRIAYPRKEVFRAVETELDSELLKSVKVLQRLLKI